MTVIRCNYCRRYLDESERTEQPRKVRQSKKNVGIQKFKSTDSDYKELWNMNGADKHNWIIEHRDEIVRFMEEYGDASARHHFGISATDLLQYLPEAPDNSWRNELLKQGAESKTLRASIKLLEDEIKDLRKTIKQYEGKAPLPVVYLREDPPAISVARLYKQGLQMMKEGLLR